MSHAQIMTNFMSNSLSIKVIIPKSLGGVSLVLQDTIEFVSWPIFTIKFLRKKIKFFLLHFMQLFIAETKIFL